MCLVYKYMLVVRVLAVCLVFFTAEKYVQNFGWET
jgi:hypothetical protein